MHPHTIQSSRIPWRSLESEGITDPGENVPTPAALAKRLNRMTVGGQAALVLAINFWSERGWRPVLARAVAALSNADVRELVVGLLFNDSDDDVREAIQRALKMIPEGKANPAPWAKRLPGLTRN